MLLYKIYRLYSRIFVYLSVSWSFVLTIYHACAIVLIMNQDMFKPAYNQRLDQISESDGNRTKKRLARIAVAVLSVGSITGIAHNLSGGSKSEAEHTISYEHEVSDGDTLSGIVAENCQVAPGSIEANDLVFNIAKANELPNLHISTGDTITVPLDDRYCELPE